MEIWTIWWNLIENLRPACRRYRTFVWMVAVLIGFIIRPDLLGVTSIIRAIGLAECCYARLLALFHSKALVIQVLTKTWTSTVLNFFPVIRFKDRIVVIGDGLKVAKSGKKMPGVKKLHQQSESNTKPTYIFGHSCQAIAVLAGTIKSCVAVPLIARIHEGIKLTNRDKRSLLDKMMSMTASLQITIPYYFVADAYYASHKVIKEVLQSNNHVVTRVKSNAVAFTKVSSLAQKKRGRGAPKKYGNKVYLRTLFCDTATMASAQSPVYGDTNVMLSYRCVDLLWRCAGQVVRFVAVKHPNKGKIILMSTDTSLTALEIIALYGLRFKIEVSFKQALRTIGGYSYHFWMSYMHPIGRKGKNQHLHHETEAYRQKVMRKMDAYHRFIQLGIIAQGSVQYIACGYSRQVWKHFGSWIRTIRPDILPSEMVTMMAMKNTVIDFFADSSEKIKPIKFILDRIDVERAEGAKFVA